MENPIFRIKHCRRQSLKMDQIKLRVCSLSHVVTSIERSIFYAWILNVNDFEIWVCNLKYLFLINLDSIERCKLSFGVDSTQFNQNNVNIVYATFKPTHKQWHSIKNWESEIQLRMEIVGTKNEKRIQNTQKTKTCLDKYHNGTFSTSGWLT